MDIKLHDTFSREKRKLNISHEEDFRFYCCGPTVYGPAHVGNFRTFIYQDILRRVLEIQGYRVKHVRNITNVDDKTIRGARDNKVSLSEFTTKWTNFFHKDTSKLNLLLPHVEPGAVEHISQQITMIERLIEKENAYISEDNSVYFDVSSFKTYGKLSRLDTRELLSQNNSTDSNSRVNLADEYSKEDVSDFALWKSEKEGEEKFSWNSPWGRGRPGWHLECSAMCLEHLGATIDLHSGGVDLIFPHHENEIAQSEATSESKFSKHWFHIAHLKVENQKMSKSLGNLFTLKDLEKKGFSPIEYRYLISTGHYRQPFNFTFDALNSAKNALSKIANFILKLIESESEFENLFNNGYESLIQKNIKSQNSSEIFASGFFQKSWLALADDLNTPKAIGEMFKIINSLTKNEIIENDKNKIFAELLVLLSVLGIENEIKDKVKLELSHKDKSSKKVPDEISDLAKQRWEAKISKDWAKADELRNIILEKGWIILDKKDGYDIEQK